MEGPVWIGLAPWLPQRSILRNYSTLVHVPKEHTGALRSALWLANWDFKYLRLRTEVLSTRAPVQPWLALITNWSFISSALLPKVLCQVYLLLVKIPAAIIRAHATVWRSACGGNRHHNFISRFGSDGKSLVAVYCRQLKQMVSSISHLGCTCLLLDCHDHGLQEGHVHFYSNQCRPLNGLQIQVCGQKLPCRGVQLLTLLVIQYARQHNVPVLVVTAVSLTAV